MSNDVSEELLKKINKTFTLSYQNSKKIKKLLEAIKNRDSDFFKAWDYAEEVGRILADAYMKNLSSDVLPDGKMFYDTAYKILNPTLENNTGLISAYICGAMDIMNEKAGINVKARKPSYNVNKTIGLVKKVSEAEHFDDVKKYLNEPVITNALSVVDEAARVNADLHYNLGYTPVIKRIASFGCCKWCRGLEGIVDYDPRMDRDIFRRHAHCRCKVIYDPGDSNGKVQDVYTKEWEISRGLAVRKGSINQITAEHSEGIHDSTRRMIDLEMHKLEKEFPMLKGKIEEISFVSELGDDAMRASVGMTLDGQIRMRLKINKKIFSNEKEIDNLTKMTPETLSPKDGLYGYLKHEYIHFLEYYQCMKNEETSEAAWEAICSGKYADDIIKKALSICGLPNNSSTMELRISSLSAQNNSEAVAEACSSSVDNDLTAAVKKLVKKKWR